MTSSEREFDILVFGASGYTGQYVVEEIARTIAGERVPSGGKVAQMAEDLAEDIMQTVMPSSDVDMKSKRPLKWGVAGRSRSKLIQCLKTAETFTGISLSQVPVVIADVNNQQSLISMCQKTELMINCVGPYSLYGEDVVRACLAAATHHLDLTGEPEFMLNLSKKYHDEAREKGVFIIPSCGFGSIVPECARLFAEQQMQGDISDMRLYIGVHWGREGGRMHTGTLMSTCEVLARVPQTAKLMKERFTEKLPRPERRGPRPGMLSYNKELCSWCANATHQLPDVFTESAMEDAYLNDNQKPYHYDSFLRLGGCLALVGFLFILVVTGILSQFKLGKRLVEKYASILTLGLFSRSGPTRKQVETSSSSVDVFCEDQKGTMRHFKVTGPEFAYVTSGITISQGAYTVLTECAMIQEKGGVLSPATAFKKTSLIKRLQHSNIKFQEC